jgi:hypothetical protein
LKHACSRDTSVGEAIEYGVDNLFDTHQEARDFSVLHSVKTSSVAHPVTMVTEGPFFGDKPAGARS